MIPSKLRKDTHLHPHAPHFARIKHFFFAGFFFTLALLPILSSAADNPSSRFRLGPSLDEEGKKDEKPAPQEPTMHFDQNEWNKMRLKLEGGYEETTTVPPP